MSPLCKCSSRQHAASPQPARRGRSAGVGREAPPRVPPGDRWERAAARSSAAPAGTLAVGGGIGAGVGTGALRRSCLSTVGLATLPTPKLNHTLRARLWPHTLLVEVQNGDGMSPGVGAWYSPIVIYFTSHMQLPFDPETALLRTYYKDSVMNRSNAYLPGCTICNYQGLIGNNL